MKHDKLVFSFFYLKSIVCFAFIILFLSACTTIHLYDGQGNTHIERRFGVTKLTVSPTTDAVLAKYKQFGWSVTPVGRSLGYTTQEMAFLPQDCKIIVWVESELEVLNLKEIVGDMNSLCPVSMANH